MKVELYEINEVDDSLLKFAVVAARHNGRWIWVKNKKRKAWEIPGGHREDGEKILDAAKRELAEETGACEFEIAPVCCYSVHREEKSYGMVFFAEVAKLRASFAQDEIETVDFFDHDPVELSFPLIQPKLKNAVVEFLNSPLDKSKVFQEEKLC